MSSVLYREFVLNSPTDAQKLVGLLKQSAGPAVDRGKPLRVIVTEEGRRRSVESNAHYWGYVLRAIAENAWVGDEDSKRQFTADIWHEYYAEKFCSRVEVTLPTGEIFSRRKSTSDMTQKEFSEYVTRVQADAANEHGVQFDGVF